jgi:hypothetical protein
MRSFVAAIAFVCAALLLVAGSNRSAADGKDKKEKTVVLKGKITCPKCDLGTATECVTVLIVKGDKKEITYWFDAKSNKKYHDDICTAAKNGTVTGTVKDADKKKVISVQKVEYAK